jgi:dynein light chain roadblock-type
MCICLGVPIKSTLDNTTSVQYAALITQLCDKARSAVRDIDPTNDLTFLRLRSKKHEILVAPGQYTTRYNRIE